MIARIQIVFYFKPETWYNYRIMDELETLRHSASHVLAQAVKNLYPDVKLAIGPATKDGFYYDFDFGGKVVTAEDFPAVEREMEKIVRADYPFEREEVSRGDALNLMRGAGEIYKIELIEGLPDGEVITLYKNGNFIDLCRGPHVKSTGCVKAFKLVSVAGAYWRGDEKNKMLTRIYGAAFNSREELDARLLQIEEIKRRDHRKLGASMELFHIDDTAPGMPFFLPRGWRVYTSLMEMWREEHARAGYNEISGPVLSHRRIWETSGHWAHYRDNMFLVDNDGKPPEYAAKPMNCPNAVTVYRTKVRSYRDLPLRYSTNDVLHRNEKSGTLHGLMRVQMFRQDDAHIFVTKGQIAAEIGAIIELADKLYAALGLKYRVSLSTRPADFMGDKGDWDRAEDALRAILNGRYGRGGYLTDEGGGAFYGPKIDFRMEDAIGREWQLGTVQLDFQLPKNFGITYTEAGGALVEPVLLHRAVFGSLERFIGVLIEHFAGDFPFFIAPLPVGIVPIKPQHNKYALKIRARLLKAGIYAEADTADAPMGGKINEYRVAKAPYILAVGDRETESGTVAVRVRGGGQVTVGVSEFVRAVVKLKKTRSLVLETFAKDPR